MHYFLGLLFLGSLLLYLGTEGLIRGASRLALFFNISSIIIGVTVVSLATSLPELVTTVLAKWVEGKDDIALGNIIGSNIANIGLVLPLAALLIPIPIAPAAKTREAPFMLLSVCIFSLLLLPGSLSRLSSAFLLSCFSLYLLYQYKIAFQHKDEILDKEIQMIKRDILPQKKPSSLAFFWKQTFLIIIGSLFISFGAKLLISGAVGIAQLFGISNRIIGLTLVAVGTSLPELATTLLATIKKEHDILLGNILGSNIFNSLAITGVCGLGAPLTFSYSLLLFDIPIMLFFCLLLTIFLFFSRYIGRFLGICLLAFYTLYYVILYF